MSKIKIAACSGIGKALGLMARESALYVTEVLEPEKTEIVCLAHVVKGDEEAQGKVQGQPCISIDGCPKYCAKKSLELGGADMVADFMAATAMKNHRGKDAGNGSDLSEDGWVMTKELAESVAQCVRENTKEGN